MSAHVEIVSPIPPMRTGTADYLDQIVRRICSIPASSSRSRIVVDFDFLETSCRPASLHGIPVCDYRDCPDEIAVGSTRIYFLANNDHHAYVYMMLERQKSLASGKSIAVIHDVSSFMLQRFRTGNGQHRLDHAELLQATEGQYGGAAARLLCARLDGDMPDIFEFVTHCQQVALDRTHEIWVHSHFAAAKLICESQMPVHRYPRIKICSHPRPNDVVSPSATWTDAKQAAPKLRIGVFGWVTPPKRVVSIIRGLSLALDRLGADAAGEIELMVVGRKPPENAYDPQAEVARYDLASIVHFIDYPPADVLESLQSSCQLIFNLRFPSCGETSGTLASAKRTGARVITSRYQAFNEIASQGDGITPLPPFDEWAVASLVCDAFKNRTRKPSSPDAMRFPTPSIAPVEKLVLAEILAVAARARSKTGTEISLP